MQCCQSIAFGTAGGNALHVAAGISAFEIVKLLLESRSSANSKRTTDAATPLHEAARRGHGATARHLLCATAAVDATTTPDGYTPLHLARSY